MLCEKKRLILNLDLLGKTKKQSKVQYEINYIGKKIVFIIVGA